MVAEENVTIYMLRAEFLENLSKTNPPLKTKMDAVKKNNFKLDKFRAASVHIGPVLDYSKSYKYQKQNKMKRRNWKTLNDMKDKIIRKILRNRELA